MIPTACFVRNATPYTHQHIQAGASPPASVASTGDLDESQFKLGFVFSPVKLAFD